MQFYNDQEVLSQNKTSSVVLPIAKVYLYFALALIISALAAFTFPYIAVAIGGAENGINVYMGGIIVSALLLFPLSIAMAISSFRARISSKGIGITICYILYSLAMGVLLSSCFMAFEIEDIYYSLFITAGAFLIMSAVGFATKGRLNGAISFVIGAFFAVFILSLINVFFFNETIYWIISFAMLFIILMYVAIDTNRIKQLAQSGHLGQSNHMAIYCAYMLYTDFITIFLYILRFVAAFKDNQ